MLVSDHLDTNVQENNDISKHFDEERKSLYKILTFHLVLLFLFKQKPLLNKILLVCLYWKHFSTKI